MKNKTLSAFILFSAVSTICGNLYVKEVSAKAEEKGAEIEASTLEELNELVPQEIEARVAALNGKYEKLQLEIDTYEKYAAGKDKIEAYYASVYQDMQNTCIRMREYCSKYAQIIYESEKSNDEKYKDLEEMYDVVYDDAGEDIYDEYYDGVLEDIYDVYYDGILEDAYDTVGYEEWSNLRSEEYERWSDTRSDAYEEWSDFRSEVYEFWSDMRGEFWDDDMDRAKKKMDDFEEDTKKMKEDLNGEVSAEKSEAQENPSKKDENKNEKKADAGEMRQEFKEAMDSYEAFYDKYCEFMKKYNANPTDIELISAYSDIVVEMVEMSEKFQKWEDNDLNTEELKYYIEVNNRVAQKMVEAAQ